MEMWITARSLPGSNSHVVPAAGGSPLPAEASSVISCKDKNSSVVNISRMRRTSVCGLWMVKGCSNGIPLGMR